MNSSSSQIIICPPTTTNRLVHVSSLVPTASPDTLLFTEAITFGIGEVRNLQQFFTTGPQASAYKTALILYAELLTPEAQNALLKLLEEPPTSAQIILVTDNLYRLLPTVVSRCQISNSHTLVTPAPLSDLSFLKNLPDYLSVSDSLASQETLPQTLLSLIEHFRSLLKTSPHPVNLYNLTLVLYANKLLKTNTNSKLILDYLLSHLKQSS
jgi:DNA polymerase-3 subunit delta'